MLLMVQIAARCLAAVCPNTYIYCTGRHLLHYLPMTIQFHFSIYSCSITGPFLSLYIASSKQQNRKGTEPGATLLLFLGDLHQSS